MKNNIEIEEIEIDPTLWGNHLEEIISWYIPKKVIDWMHDNECGCNKRKEWLNDKCYQYRDRKYKKSLTNFDIAKEKVQYWSTALGLEKE